MLDFNETHKGFTTEEAIKEAKRCLGCKKPMCQVGCPASLPIRDFIAFLKDNKVDEAAAIITANSNLACICSIVCPHEKQCVGHCVLNKKGTPIRVGQLERYIIQHAAKPKIERSCNKYNVAIIGGGPAGISCALELAKSNINVTIFEKEKYLGGVLTYGIPQFRLDKKRLEPIISELNDYGVKIITNSFITYEEIIRISKNNNKVFISVGLWGSKSLGIPGLNANGVYDALHLLKKVNSALLDDKQELLPTLAGRTLVIGAGNVAMDACRTAIRLGSSEVGIVYRRSIEEAPACKMELDEAACEGVNFHFLTNPVEIIVDDCNQVKALKCEIMILGEKDSSGRAKPIGSGKYLTMECENVIQAIGQSPDKRMTILQSFENDYEYLEVDENLKTSMPNIYAGGDIVLGASTVVEAMMQGRQAAKEIIKSLK